MLRYTLGLSLVCTPFPDRSAPGSSRESAPGWSPSIASSPVLAGPSLVLGIPVRKDLLSQAEGITPP